MQLAGGTASSGPCTVALERRSGTRGTGNVQCPVTGEFSWNLVDVRMLRVENSPALDAGSTLLRRDFLCVRQKHCEV